MESFFGIGGPELLLILVLATVILGPLRMIQAARQLGRLMRDLRNYYTELTKGLNEELAALSELEASVRDEVNSAMPKPEELQVSLPASESTAQSGPGRIDTFQPDSGSSVPDLAEALQPRISSSEPEATGAIQPDTGSSIPGSAEASQSDIATSESGRGEAIPLDSGSGVPDRVEALEPATHPGGSDTTEVIQPGATSSVPGTAESLQPEISSSESETIEE
jgi:Tat protein translocase TatB subunit